MEKPQFPPLVSFIILIHLGIGTTYNCMLLSEKIERSFNLIRSKRHYTLNTNWKFFWKKRRDDIEIFVLKPITQINIHVGKKPLRYVAPNLFFKKIYSPAQYIALHREIERPINKPLRWEPVLYRISRLYSRILWPKPLTGHEFSFQLCRCTYASPFSVTYSLLFVYIF